MKRKYVKSLVSMLLVVCMAVTVVGCGNKTEPAKKESQAEKKKVLKWNVDTEPEALDPMIMGSTAMQIVNNTFEGLLRTYEGEVTYGIADSYEISEDELTYTFHIRDDA